MFRREILELIMMVIGIYLIVPLILQKKCMYKNILLRKTLYFIEKELCALLKLISRSFSDCTT